MSTVSEPRAVRQHPAPRLMLPPAPPALRQRARHWSRLTWLLGLVLLTGSLVGASQVLHSRQSEPQTNAKSGAERTSTAHGVVCLGSVAIDSVPPDGVPLAPAQIGEVREVLAYEGQHVKKGAILLRVDEEPAQKTVAQAEIAVRIAQGLLAEARQGLERHRAGVDAQQAAAEAAKHKLAAGEAQVRHLEDIKEKVPEYSIANDLTVARETVNALRSAVAAEEGKLRELQANRPEPKIEQAQGNVELNQAKLELARLGLKKCVLEAPADGTVLRINSAVGTLITGQTRQGAIQFAPDGTRIVRVEVPQEFAYRVQAGMAAEVLDMNVPDFTWAGTVKRLSDAYLPKRSAGTEVLSLGNSDAWVLECVVELTSTANPPRLGQRVRVSIGTQRAP